MLTERFVSERFLVVLNRSLFFFTKLGFLTCVDSREVSMAIDCLQFYSKIILEMTCWWLLVRKKCCLCHFTFDDHPVDSSKAAWKHYQAISLVSINIEVKVTSLHIEYQNWADMRLLPVTLFKSVSARIWFKLSSNAME